MVRPLRVEFPDALYHVTSRGDQKAPIFADARDRRRFLSILASVIEKERWKLHSFCLMGNHYHLLVETPLARLSKGMQALNSQYSQKFNRRHERCGHVLQGRFTGILVQKQTHLLQLHRYIVLNPVKAGICRRPEDWPWSNYRATCGLVAPPQWLELDWTLAQFGADRKAAIGAYVRFVHDGIEKHGEPTVTRQLFVGSKDFASEIARRLRGRVLDDDIPWEHRQPNPPTVAGISSAVAGEWGVSVEQLRKRRGGEPRIAAIYLCAKLTGLTAPMVGAAFGIRRGRVSNVVAEVEKPCNAALLARIGAVKARIEAIVLPSETPVVIEV